MVRSFAAIIVATLTFAAAAPALAADGPAPSHFVARKGKSKGDVAIDAKRFNAMLEAKIAEAERHLEHALKERSVEPKLAATIRADFRKAAATLREAAAKATADGTVHAEEARQIRELALRLRRELLAKHGGAVLTGKRNDFSARRDGSSRQPTRR